MDDVFETTTNLPKMYVRFHIHKNRLEHQIYLDQCLYIEQIIRKYGFDNSTPINHLDIHFSAILNTVNDIDHDFPYMEMIGSLQCINVGIHHNISFFFSQTIKFSSQPTHSQIVNFKKNSSILREHQVKFYALDPINIQMFSLLVVMQILLLMLMIANHILVLLFSSIMD